MCAIVGVKSGLRNLIVTGLRCHLRMDVAPWYDKRMGLGLDGRVGCVLSISLCKKTFCILCDLCEIFSKDVEATSANLGAKIQR